METLPFCKRVERPRIRLITARVLVAELMKRHPSKLSPLRFDGPFPDELVVALRREIGDAARLHYHRHSIQRRVCGRNSRDGEADRKSVRGNVPRQTREKRDRSFRQPDDLTSQPSGQSAHLVIEMSADGDADQAIGALADALGHNLADALDAARVDWSAKDPKAFIADPRYRLNAGVGWFGDLEIVYTSTTGVTPCVAFSMRRSSPESRRQFSINRTCCAKPRHWSGCGPSASRLKSKPISNRCSRLSPPRFSEATKQHLWDGSRHPRLAGLGHLLASHAVIVVGVLATIAYAAFTSSSFLGGVYAAIVGVFWTLVAFLVLIAGLAVGLLLLLRSRESADIPDDATPDPKIVAEITARENAVIADDDDRQKGMNEAAGPHEQIQGRWKGELRERGQRLPRHAGIAKSPLRRLDHEARSAATFSRCGSPFP